MKYLKIFFLSILLFNFSFQGLSQSKRKSDKNTMQWRYEIEAVNIGVQGTYLVKAWTYAKKPNKAIAQAKKNAIHGVIFRGFGGKNRVPGQKPLAELNSEIQNENFFKTFFNEGGKYLKYATVSNDGSIAAGDLMKVGKEYKVGVIVSVNVSELRKDLEDAGIIKGLSAGF
jgi:hypothetical protein